MPKNKRLFVTTGVLVCLAVLIGLQVHNSEKFDWHKFWLETRNIHWAMILLGVLLIHGNYFLRAVRWSIFLRPIKGRISSWELVPSQIVGFAGLALLGRPGELIRPYLVARREQLTFSSQLAVWTIERIFDLASIGLILGINVLVSPLIRQLPSHSNLLWAAGLLLTGVSAAAVFAYAIRRNGPRIAAQLEKLIGRFAPRAGRQIAEKITAFGDGLHTIHDAASFASLAAVSLLIWIVIVLAYLAVARAYPEIADTMSFSDTVSFVVLLLGCSVAGSMIALPAVGGGPQLATISAMVYFFKLKPEVATSCGIMLWLTTFASVIPTGLIVARMEHISLRKLSEESGTNAEPVHRVEASL